MNKRPENSPLLLEELEVVVGGLSRPWAGWQPVDLAATSGIDGTSSDQAPPARTAPGDH
jgi:hypothetical protein